MQLQKVKSSPVLQLHEAISEVQETALRNTQLNCKMNEARAQLDHVRFVTNKLAYLHFLQCNPYIV
jgi:hypothetical protein